MREERYDIVMRDRTTGSPKFPDEPMSDLVSQCHSVTEACTSSLHHFIGESQKFPDEPMSDLVSQCHNVTDWRVTNDHRLSVEFRITKVCR